MPGTSHRPGQHTIRFIIIRNLLSPGIPGELFLGKHGDVQQMTYSARSLAYLCRCERLGSSSHGVKEILMMARSSAERDFVRTNLLSQQGFRLGFEATAVYVDKNPAVGTLELDTPGGFAYTQQADAVSVLTFKLKFVERVEETVLGPSAAT